MGGCERCLASGICTGAPCNFECRLVTENECETLVMGRKAVKGEDISKISACLQCFRVDRVDDLLIDAGVLVGDLITHINGKFPENQQEFAVWFMELKPGDVVKVWRGLDRFDIKLG